jgi:hypothetical protein
MFLGEINYRKGHAPILGQQFGYEDNIEKKFSVNV